MGCDPQLEKHLHGGAEENQENEDSRSPGQDLNSRSSEYQTGVLNPLCISAVHDREGTLDKHVYPKLDEAVTVFVTVRIVPVPVWTESPRWPVPVPLDSQRNYS